MNCTIVALIFALIIIVVIICNTSLHTSSHYVFCLGMRTIGKAEDRLLRAVHASSLTSTILTVILVRAQQAGMRSGTTAVLRTHSSL